VCVGLCVGFVMCVFVMFCNVCVCVYVCACVQTVVMCVVFQTSRGKDRLKGQATKQYQ